MSDSSSPLLERLARLRERVADLVEHRSATDPTADDPMRGMYLTDDAVRHLLFGGAQDAAPAPGPDTAPSPGPDPADAPDPAKEPAGAEEPDPAEEPSDDDRLHWLAHWLRLSPLDTQILLIALAPDLDRTFESLYAYLNDDVTRRRATVALALDLCGVPTHSAAGRSRFHPAARLVARGLLEVEEPERPFLSRSLRVPDRVLAHLLGDDTPDPALGGTVRLLPYLPAEQNADDAQGTTGPLARRLAGELSAHPLTVYLREHRDGDGLAFATAALGAAGLPALHLVPAERRGEHRPEEHAPAERAAGEHPPYRELLREARLTGRAIVVTSLPERPEELIRALAVNDVPVLFTDPRPYDPQWCDTGRDPIVLDAPRRRAGDLDAWRAALGPEEPDFDLAPVVAAYRLGPGGIDRASRAARELAAFHGTPLSAAHLRLAARQQSASGLERHARRIRPDVGWNDLVLPEGPLAQLRELVLRAQHRDRVLGDWRLSAGGGRGRGVVALFAGDSGTGKTLSAEVVAGELGLDLYVVQLPSVVDKYVGETEKNLERIFTEADRTDAVLLFDEADAVFGKRSEVSSSNDRHANMESAYLLQRLESFDGIALLTTNLRSNIDDAFTRRLDLVVDFPFPDEEQRLALWRHSLAHVPCADDVDPASCAADFELAGGSIRSAVVTAAYAAAGRGDGVSTDDLLAGAQREYRKAGRLVLDDASW
ncbi:MULTISPECIES: ATP-binding protein [Streptomyces]|uniref:AAA ATPase central domain protein n=1 Tax=Streptomyces pratensis (strain ATCC 33331 / IAF-45CD) TaxID=591167 RepID=A0A8D4BGB2_STRFA|nr:ATP-binding protein [Streptomyces sp. PAMC 26508]AGJ57485.1 ATPase [Streptomyces sp. PAMC 26508]MYT50617.1 AAA family ATPase [Streptomyces sp. SID7815]